MFRSVTYTATTVQLKNLLALAGDTDGDQDVDLSDYNTLPTNFNPSGTYGPYLWEDGNFDGDGDIDLYVANDGEPNHAWINDGAGHFVESALTMGLAVNLFGQSEAGMGIAVGDLDGDGDLDLILTQAGDRARLLRNDQETDHHWLRIDPGRLLPGGWIELHQGDRVQRRLIGQTRSYLSQCENIITFGLGKDLTPPIIRFMAPGKSDWQESRPDSIDTIYSLEW